MFIEIIIILGFVMIIIEITRAYYKCPPNRTVYRYIPRSFKEEQENPIPINDILNDMFLKQEPWQASFNIYENAKIPSLPPYNTFTLTQQ